jgi:hypothetical protein
MADLTGNNVRVCSVFRKLCKQLIKAMINLLFNIDLYMHMTLKGAKAIVTFLA